MSTDDILKIASAALVIAGIVVMYTKTKKDDAVVAWITQAFNKLFRTK